jgi:hypothetical protein
VYEHSYWGLYVVKVEWGGGQLLTGGTGSEATTISECGLSPTYTALSPRPYTEKAR